MSAEAYGQRKLTVVDKFGVYLSRRPVMHVVDDYDKPSLLDVGCGHHASLLVDLAPRLSRGVGVELTIDDAVKRTPSLSFREETIEHALPALAAEGQTFDVVLMISVLEHLWEPAEILARLRKLVAPGGSLVVNVPNWLGKTFLEISAFKLGMSPADSIDDHKTYYWKEQLWPLLVRAGFKPSKIKMRYHKLGLNLFAVARAD